jgi:hypothetical protein
LLYRTTARKFEPDGVAAGDCAAGQSGRIRCCRRDFELRTGNALANRFASDCGHPRRHRIWCTLANKTVRGPG